MMANYLELDLDSVVRIGLMYLDGDQFEDVQLDRYGDTDYDFDRFANVKNALTRLENINPSLALCATLWQFHPKNPRLAVPVVAGKSLPPEGWTRTLAPEPMMLARDSGLPQTRDRGQGLVSTYYPVKNSDGEIVGVLELLQGMDHIEDL